MSSNKKSNNTKKKSSGLSLTKKTKSVKNDNKEIKRGKKKTETPKVRSENKKTLSLNDEEKKELVIKAIINSGTKLKHDKKIKTQTIRIKPLEKGESDIEQENIPKKKKVENIKIIDLAPLTEKKIDIKEAEKIQSPKEVGKNETNNLNIIPLSLKKEEKDAGPKVILTEKENNLKPHAIHNAKEEKKDSIHVSKPLSIYKKIALSFLFLVLALILVAAYYFVPKVNIILTPNQEKIRSNLNFVVYNSDDKDYKLTSNSIPGIVTKMTIEKTQIATSSGATILGDETVGTAIIYNNSSKNQPLVATTRLLTPDNKLFRIKDTVNVPAGGQIEVAIYADKSSADMTTGPTKFSIPGLWAGLQDKIYAQSYKEITNQQKAEKYVKEEDIENALSIFKTDLPQQLKKEVEKVYGNYDQVLFKVNDASVASKIDAKAGDKKETFSIILSAEVIIVAFNEGEVINLATNNFEINLDEDKKLVAIDKKNIVYNLDNFNEKEETATVTATYEGIVTLNQSGAIVEKNRITGLTNKQLEVYLSALPNVSSFKIEYYPSFLKRVPELEQNINTQVEEN